jgi:hypothetical protein
MPLRTPTIGKRESEADGDCSDESGRDNRQRVLACGLIAPGRLKNTKEPYYLHPGEATCCAEVPRAAYPRINPNVTAEDEIHHRQI